MLYEKERKSLVSPINGPQHKTIFGWLGFLWTFIIFWVCGNKQQTCIYEVTIYFGHYMQTAKDLGPVNDVEHQTRGFVTNRKSQLGWMFWTVRTVYIFVQNTNSPWEMFVFAFSVKSHVCLLIALDLYASPTGGEKRCLLWKWDFLRLCLVFAYCHFSRSCSVCAGWCGWLAGEMSQ